MSIYAFIGSLTQPAPYAAAANGQGITICSFDEATGALAGIGAFRDIADPIWLVGDTSGHTLYAAAAGVAGGEGVVTALRFDSIGKTLTQLSSHGTGGVEPCHASVSADGSQLLVANYCDDRAGAPDNGLTVFPILPDGALGAASFSTRQTGSGPDAIRQLRAHAHCALPSPDGRWTYVADLGLDKILAYPADSTGDIVDGYLVAAALPPGTGPRHFRFSPDGKHLLLVNELIASVMGFSIEPDGTLTHLATMPLAAMDGSLVYPAGIVHHAATDTYLVSLRVSHEIVAFKLDAAGKALTLTGRWPSGGLTPRDLCLSPSGQHLLVANHDDDMVAIFKVSAEPELRLTPLDGFSTGTPMSIVFTTT